MTTLVTVTVHNITYTDIVPRTSMMDPKTEDVVYSNELQNGMMVLASIDGRVNTEEIKAYSPDSFHRVLECNRWCRVTKIRQDEEEHYPNDENGRNNRGFVHFIGEYEDGTKAVRSSPSDAGWLVKKDSVLETTGELPPNHNFR
jgi:hypothetical protein